MILIMETDNDYNKHMFDMLTDMDISIRILMGLLQLILRWFQFTMQTREDGETRHSEGRPGAADFKWYV